MSEWTETSESTLALRIARLRAEREETTSMGEFAEITTLLDEAYRDYGHLHESSTNGGRCAGSKTGDGTSSLADSTPPRSAVV